MRVVIAESYMNSKWKQWFKGNIQKQESRRAHTVQQDFRFRETCQNLDFMNNVKFCKIQISRNLIICILNWTLIARKILLLLSLIVNCSLPDVLLSTNDCNYILQISFTTSSTKAYFSAFIYIFRIWETKFHTNLGLDIAKILYFVRSDSKIWWPS